MLARDLVAAPGYFLYARAEHSSPSDSIYVIWPLRHPVRSPRVWRKVWLVTFRITDRIAYAPASVNNRWSCIHATAPSIRDIADAGAYSQSLCRWTTKHIAAQIGGDIWIVNTGSRRYLRLTFDPATTAILFGRPTPYVSFFRCDEERPICFESSSAHRG